MIAITFFSEVGVAEIALTLGALAYVTHLILDTLGISRTSKTLRVENEDLLRRNRELEDITRRCEDEIERLKGEVDVLVTQVAELQQRDQAAVLRAVADHDRQANIRHEALFGVLTEIRDALRVGAA